MVAVIIVCYLLDLATKNLAIKHLDSAQTPTFLGGWLSFPLVFNSGAAFSMGESATLLFTGLSIVALAALVFWAFWKVSELFSGLAVALLTAGVAGNLTDRLFRPPKPFEGHVVDFIAVKHFAVFNFADVCITAAAALMVISVIMSASEEIVESSEKTVSGGTGDLVGVSEVAEDTDSKEFSEARTESSLKTQLESEENSELVESAQGGEDE